MSASKRTPDEDGFVFIVSPPPVKNQKGTPSRETERLLAHIRTALADAPYGEWVQVLSGGENRCQRIRQRIYTHKQAGRLPKNVAYRMRPAMVGGFGVWVRYDTADDEDE